MVVRKKDGGFRAWQFAALSTVERTELCGRRLADRSGGSKLQLLGRQRYEKSTNLRHFRAAIFAAETAAGRRYV